MMKLRLVHEKFDLFCFALLWCRSLFKKEFLLIKRGVLSREREKNARDETETIHT